MTDSIDYGDVDIKLTITRGDKTYTATGQGELVFETNNEYEKIYYNKYHFENFDKYKTTIKWKPDERGIAYTIVEKRVEYDRIIVTHANGDSEYFEAREGERLGFRNDNGVLKIHNKVSEEVIGIVNEGWIGVRYG